VTVTDLDKAQLGLDILLLELRETAEAIGLKHSAFDEAEGSGSCPGHAFQEASAVDSVVIMVMQDFIVLVALHRVLLNLAGEAASVSCFSQEITVTSGFYSSAT
jgi:hypothetical protein